MYAVLFVTYEPKGKNPDIRFFGGVPRDVRVGDVLVMKRPHPCGESRFTVLRVGMDFRIRCVSCGREVMVPRAKVEKSIKKLERTEENNT